MTMMLHNYKSWQFHITSNGINSSIGFRDMASTVWPKCCLIWQVFGPWASPYGANGSITITVHNFRPRQFHRTSNGENHSTGYREMGSANLAATRPVKTIPFQPGGLRGSKNTSISIFFTNHGHIHMPEARTSTARALTWHGLFSAPQRLTNDDTPLPILHAEAFNWKSITNHEYIHRTPLWCTCTVCLNLNYIHI